MRYILLVLFAFVTTFASAQVQFLGSPTTTVISRGNFRTDSIFYLPKRSKAPTDTAALRYQISDSTVYVWTGSQWVKAGGGVGSLTGSGVAGYMPEFTTSTNLDTTRLYHSAGRFAIGSTTTSNGVFNVYGGQSYLDTSLKIGSQTFLADEGKNEVYVNTTSDAGTYALQVAGDIYAAGSFAINTSGQTRTISTYYGAGTNGFNIYIGGGGTSSQGSGGQGSNNTSLGVSALNANTTGGNNTAIGRSTMISTTSGFNNTAIGAGSMVLNTTGVRNTSIGNDALYTNSTGNDNVAVGSESLLSNTSGYENNAIGYRSLYLNTTGYQNTANGKFALYFNTTGYLNVAIGVEAGTYVTAGTGNATSNNSLYLGYDARASADGNTNEIVIGASARGNGSNTATFGNSSIVTTILRGETLIATTTDAGDYKLQVNGNALISGNIRTSAPAGGTANDWRLGTVATVSPTSPNRTIEVSIGGTIYYIHAKTTND